MQIALAHSSGPVFTGARIAAFDLPPGLSKSGQRISLALRNLEKTADSLVLRLLVSQPGGTSKVLGELYTYGEGPRRENDDPERFLPVTMTLDVTDSVRRLAGRVEISLRVLDQHEHEITDVPIEMDAVELDVDESK